MRLPWRKEKLVIQQKSWYDCANETLREYWANVEEFEKDPPKRKWWRFWERG